jgi:hypothetical protein
MKQEKTFFCSFKSNILQNAVQISKTFFFHGQCDLKKWLYDQNIEYWKFAKWL